MNDLENEITVLELPLFKKQFKKFSDNDQLLIADQIDLLVEDPLLGQQKKGELSHFRVHKFILNNSQVLLGYCWENKKLTLFLLSVGPHENFYKSLSNRRDADLDHINR